jgi:hypothetical protein
MPPNILKVFLGITNTNVVILPRFYKIKIKVKHENSVNMSLLVDCTNSLLSILNYVVVNIYVNTFLKQRKNCEYSTHWAWHWVL